MKIKTFRSPLVAKADGEPGEFRAVFSTFNVKDHDGDVTLPGAFTDGQKVRISYWGHRWADLPVGRGEIHSDEKEAWVDGRFFLDTEAGKETYQTVKNLGELQEWSYGFDILERSEGEYDGDQVQFLRRLDVHEVSPVMLGAGIDTRTTAIKEGRRNSGSDRDRIQRIHDLTLELGAKCAEPDQNADDTDGKAREGTPSGKRGTLAERIALELIEAGID